MRPTEDPMIRAFRGEAIVDRQIDELIGIVKGVMADGMVSQGEVEFLINWMNSNRAAANLWPAKALYPRLVAAMADGKIDIEEEKEILSLLMNTVGGNTAPSRGASSDSTRLPVSQPPSPVRFEQMSFCFTGAFNAGNRRWCEQAIEARGGSPSANITKKLHYLVIGDIGNENWIHSTHGRKIEKALEYNSLGANIVILNEEHWYNHL